MVSAIVLYVLPRETAGDRCFQLAWAFSSKISAGADLLWDEGHRLPPVLFVSCQARLTGRWDRHQLVL